jgi:fructosamine-3-kinase
MMTPALQDEIEKGLGVKISAVTPLSAANNANIYKLTTKDNRVCVAKVAAQGLEVEAFMLKYLREKSKLPVPDVYYAHDGLILMSFVESHHSVDNLAVTDAAKHLAALHQIRGESYGFTRDTLIGFLRQPNTPSQDWVKFYTENRLLYMAGEALKENKIEKALMKKVEKLAGKLDKYIKKPNPPALIHGDVWGGNILAQPGKIVSFLDPAIYYADPEIELAFIAMLNTFNENFFARYGEINPIAAGFFEERAEIYGLYYLLVHTRLFGASYARKAQKIVDKFV